MCVESLASVANGLNWLSNLTIESNHDCELRRWQQWCNLKPKLVFLYTFIPYYSEAVSLGALFSCFWSGTSLLKLRVNFQGRAKKWIGIYNINLIFLSDFLCIYVLQFKCTFLVSSYNYKYIVYATGQMYISLIHEHAILFIREPICPVIVYVKEKNDKQTSSFMHKLLGMLNMCSYVCLLLI